MSGLRIHIREKRFDGAPVLGECTIDAAPGEFIALVGPSGSGKSTLLSLVAGLDADYDGDITWNGAPLSAVGESPAHMGMMFQEPRLMPWLNALDNVRLAEAERVAREPGYQSNAPRLLEEVGLGEAQHVWPNHLSGGMQRRVALARAFVVEPQLLLMDEPFVSLDMPTGNRLRRSLLRLCERQRPLVLFVTHDLREALALADRVLFFGDTPARVLLDHPVEGARGKDLESAEVASAQQVLLARYPQLLSGILDPSQVQTYDEDTA
ncbi:ABC transporter-like protein [Salinisphaera shabanensis T35B1]|uniref:Sulfate-thiosulfate ABC transporter ATP-binding protein n=1 Tax=Salinisphaera shabanensis E1L3A TaxID=1033802 RepID=U2FUM9_9GAMM|nr:ABC transporter ATP-binding protein [Salinisphaera shabanensis]ERJ19649.1 Sulfate-thiosulfate ABC transporter ATP-binding protein [Salinisphaera shabanensis E1L3A]